MARKLHVAVIGAGPSGLSASRHLAADPEHFTFVCYEQCDDIGGTWRHTPDAQELDSNTQPNSVAGQRPFTVYDALRCNLTIQVMEFPDFKFLPEYVTEKPNMTESEVAQHFTMYYDIQNYLNKYTNHFHLRPHIRLNEQVDNIVVASVAVTADDSEEKFTIQSHNTVTRVRNVEVFDAVFVCNGHYAKPVWPNHLKNLPDFEGRIMHCKYYRGPDKDPLRTAKKIVIFGQRASGPDIAMDIVRRIPGNRPVEVILAGHNSFLAEKSGQLFPKNAHAVVRLKPDLTEMAGPHAVRFVDGTIEADVDVLIVAIGFEYYFPFLSTELTLRHQERRLQPLYKHIVHIDHPRLCFIGLHHLSMGFQTFDLQSRYVLAMLRNEFKLPTRADMLKFEADDYKMRTSAPLNWAHRFAHELGVLSKPYHDELVAESHIAPFNEQVFGVFDAICKQIAKNPECFREMNFS